MTIYFSLGSNLGNREQTILQAVQLIEQNIGICLRKSSFFYSEPWGFESNNTFCNICASFSTNLRPLDILHITQDIEHYLGRNHKSINGKYHDRTIDIDLLLYIDANGQSIKINTPTLTIPHPLMYQRDFVLSPLKEIYPYVDKLVSLPIKP